MARYAGRRSKCIQSTLGELRLQRAYYHCTQCGNGFFPRDRALGIENTSASPGLQRMIAHVGALVSFAEGQELLKDLAGVAVDAKQVERVAEAVGREVAQDEQAQTLPLTMEALPPTLYVGLDGTGLPMRPEALVGIAGKQPDGSAKTREAKLCCVWSAEGRDERGRPVRDVGSVSYTAAIESAATLDTARELSPFAQRVQREADRRRLYAASRLAALGDGALWIWKIVDELFPGAIQILDRYHAKEHLSDVAKALFGKDAATTKSWAEERHTELDSGQTDAILAALQEHATTSEEAEQCVGYIENNRQRMRYPLFEAMGLVTASGQVEAGCRVVAGTRLKRSGMRWTVPGANAILALRACRLSGRFEDFWQRRAASNKAAA